MERSVRRLFIDDGTLYSMDLIDPTAAIEDSFSGCVRQILAQLHADCHVAVFNPLIENDGAGWRPDLAVIHRSLAYWFVVEVETINHSLVKHVLPQVTAFRDGRFGDEASVQLSAITHRSLDECATILRYVPRYVAVVANHNSVEWRHKLEAESVQFVGIDVFRRRDSWPGYLVHGELYVPQSSVGFGIVHASMQAIQFKRDTFWCDGRFVIADPTGTGAWKCTCEQGRAWLQKEAGLITFSEGSFVQALVKDDGSLLLRPM